VSRLRRSSHTPAANGSKWIRSATRWAIYYRDAFACLYCTHVGQLSLDHVGAVHAHGRNNAPSNLVTCCISCNSAKQNLTTRQWYAKLRSEGVNVRQIRARIRAARRVVINREVGRFLASDISESDGNEVEGQSNE